MMQKINERKVKRPSLLLQIFILAITFFIIAFVIILSIRTQHELEKTAIEQFNQQQLILARSAATGIEIYYNELSAELSALTKLSSFKQRTPEALQYMEHAYMGFPERTSMRLLDKNGVLHYIYPFDGWRRELIGKNYSKEAYLTTPETANLMWRRCCAKARKPIVA